MLSRADFSPQLFTDLINQKGYNLKIEYSVICPCIDPTTGRPIDNCSQCDGRGNYFYNSVTTRGNITRLNREAIMAESMGALEPGNAYLTLPHGTFVAVNDRVTNLDSTAQFGEVIQHSPNGDFLRYPPVGNIIFAGIQNSPTSEVQSLVQNTDFSVNSTGEITWISSTGLGLSNGQGVAFRYYYNPVWIVINMINYVRDTQVANFMPQPTFENLPVRCLMRLDYMGSST